MTRVAPGLFVGNLPSIADRSLLECYNIKGIVSLGTGRWGFWDLVKDTTRDYVPEEKHLFVPAVDNSDQNLLVYMELVCNFMDGVYSSLSTEDPAGSILVHCDRGVSRSAAMAIAYLMRKEGHGFDNTLAIVRAQRKINPNSSFRGQLRIWEQVEYNIWEDRDARIPKEPYQAFLNIRRAEIEDTGMILGLRTEGPLGGTLVTPEACKFAYADMQTC
jgi:dual specificity phosphatase 12